LIDISAIYSRNNKADSKRLPPPFLSDYRQLVSYFSVTVNTTFFSDSSQSDR